jgi:ketosteroid isomerase-like protein
MEKEAIEKEINDQFSQLVYALNKLDIETWSEFYSKEQFLSTIVSTDYYAARRDWVGKIADYFTTREHQQIEPVAVRVTALTSNIALMTSEEKTEMRLKSGKNIQSRHVFTMIWKREQDGWKILHSHESSLDEQIDEVLTLNPLQHNSMNAGNTITKIYVDAKGSVLFACPNCSKIKKEEAQPYKDTQGPIKIECSCGYAYDVEIEFRRVIRKRARIDGIYISAANPDNWGKMIVKNISIQGCGFETLKTNLFQPDDEVKIEFQLDDAQNSLIRKKALVRSVYKKYVGCQFMESAGDFDPDLGFYLRKL